MKIAFVGKGGSGKTTLSALFSRYLASKNKTVLAIDADINQNMAMSLGFDPNLQIPPMGIEIQKIKQYLKGKNKLIIETNLMIKTTPPGFGSRLLKVTGKNPIYDYFLRQKDNINFLATGPFSEEDLGIRCYHSKVGAVELLLSHLIDQKGEFVIVDMTAGADSFSSGLFTKFDMTFLVCEPTLKSVSVYNQYKQYARDYHINLKVIGNKIESQEDFIFLNKQIGQDLIAYFYSSSFVKSLEKGNFKPLTELESKNLFQLKKIESQVNKTKKDWQKFYQYSVEFHLKNAKSWANEELSSDLTSQVDPNFNFKNYLRNYKFERR